MPRPKIWKISAAAFFAVIVVASVTYLSLTTRHKAIVKTVLLHRSKLIDPDWNVKNNSHEYVMTSPELLIDGIYKSMEGPKATNYVQLTQEKKLIWLTSFHVRALASKSGKRVSDDYICHTNVDFNDARYFGNFNLKHRIGSQYPRMTSLSHGQEDFRFPEGFGVPMFGNDVLTVTTQALNHNNPDDNFLLRHSVDIRYSDQPLKPLMSRTVFIRLPYDKRDPFKEPLDPALNQCIPVETKNHSYPDGNGNMLSGHWVIPVGKKTYRSDISEQLQITDSLRLHAAAIHVHPFATRIALFDKTSGKELFSSVISNHNGKTGLASVPQFISKEGVLLFADHSYELRLDTNNTTNVPQDMMGSMFLFFHDRELEGMIRR